MPQIRTLTSGGLGDAVMSIGKLYSTSSPWAMLSHRNWHVTHAEVPSVLLDEIGAFYESQGIESDVIQIPSSRWVEQNVKKYDHFLGTSWSSKNAHFDSWEIDPFPPMYYEEVEVDVVISPFAGRLMSRQFTTEQIKTLVDGALRKYGSKLAYVGYAPDWFDSVVRGLPGVSYLNRTSIAEAVNLICSAKAVIGLPGFVVFVACMNEYIDVYTVKGQFKDYYFHPQWRVHDLG